ncbi:MAG TPA: glycosyltransferase family protein [Nitrososphaerales archaeon]|nr:glycosyltransferase family protein [Nitrososphaerales archaeon]
MRAYLAAFGSGMGHASRMVTVAEALVAAGHEVRFSSSGEVTMWLRRRGFECDDVPLVDVVFTREGSFSATATLRSSPLILARLVRQVAREVEHIGRFSPRVVVSDSVVSTVAAARLLGVRSVAVVNQLMLFSSPRTPTVAADLITGASKAILDAFWGLGGEILVPDLPPPYTISERNLWNAGASSERARYVGFLGMTPRQTVPSALPQGWLQEKRRKRVYWQVSGPPATRTSFLEKAIECAKAMQETHLFAVSAGNPSGDTAPSAVPGGYLYGWCESSAAFIDSCDAVVSRAGHSSISEFISRAKPAVLVPIQAQSEQIGNAEKAQRLGFAVSLDERGLGPGSLADALVALSSGRALDKAREMRDVAARYDAVRSVLDVLGLS